MQLITTINCANTLGEGIIYDERNEELLWTDIQSRVFYRYQMNGAGLFQYALPFRLGSFGLTEVDHLYIMAFEKGVAFYNILNAELTWVVEIEAGIPHTRTNDGRVDRLGNFWVGTMVESHKLSDANTTNYKKGKLYCIEPAHTGISSINDIEISNSLCWSPDGSTMYHCDTPSRRIYKYKVNDSAVDLNSATLFTETEVDCYPDGSCIDAEGYLWNAQWGASQIVRYTPQGELDYSLSLPVSQPTCVCFAGKDLDLLVISSAQEGLSAEQLANEPDAGNVFIYQTDHRGLAENRCQLKPV